MNNIFLVKSPLQLLNAIEAKHHFNIDDNHCFILIMGDRKSYPQMVKLIYAVEQWKNIVLINRVSFFSANPWRQKIDYKNLEEQRGTLLRSSIFTIWRLNKLSRTISNVDRVFIGDNNNPFMRHFMNILKHKESILLDDGTATINIAKQRQYGLVYRKSNKVRKKIKLIAKRILQGLKDQHVEKVTFFTAYNVNIKDPDKKIENNFSFLRQKAGSLKKNNDVYFLGSPLSEVRFMEENSYIDQLLKVKSEFKDYNFIYVAHRREKKDKLEAIKKKLNIKVCLFDYPIEYQLAMIGPRPAMLVSFISSALDNLSIIMPETLPIISYRLDENTYNNKARIDEIYRHYESSSNNNFHVRSIS